MQGSDFYGIHNTLLRHASLPRLSVFPYAVQHGWQNAATGFETEGSPLEIWAWSERSRNAMKAFYPAEKIRTVGSPYLYLPDSPELPGNPYRRSLYILPHSSHFARIGFAQSDLERLLSSIVGTDGQCDVLAYYLDVTNELCNSLRSVNAKILLNGGLWSNDFMHTFRSNIRQYRKIYYSSFGSAVLFAQHERRATEYIDLSSSIVSSSNSYVDHLTNSDSAYDPRGQGMSTDAELGIEHKLEQAELKHLVVEGFKQNNTRKLLAKAYYSLRHRLSDYRAQVRPSLALAAEHNAAIDSLESVNLLRSNSGGLL